MEQQSDYHPPTCLCSAVSPGAGARARELRGCGNDRFTLKFSRLNLGIEWLASACDPSIGPPLPLCLPEGRAGLHCLTGRKTVPPVQDPASLQEIVPAEEGPQPCWDLPLGATVIKW